MKKYDELVAIDKQEPMTLELFANVNHFFTLLGKMFFTP